MDVKEAVHHAKAYVKDLFAEESVVDVGLEEVEFQDAAQKWLVTIGFSRPWDRPRNTLAELAGRSVLNRSYKVVHISDKTGEVLCVKNHGAQP